MFNISQMSSILHFEIIALIIDNVGENNDTYLLKELAPGLSFVPPDL